MEETWCDLGKGIGWLRWVSVKLITYLHSERTMTILGVTSQGVGSHLEQLTVFTQVYPRLAILFIRRVNTVIIILSNPSVYESHKRIEASVKVTLERVQMMEKTIDD